MAIHNILGARGEAEARNFLESGGYRIIDTNWKSGKREIDIVAFKNDIYVFIEVKTRTGGTEADEVLSRAKENNIIEAVNDYMDGIEGDAECRVDLLLVEVNGTKLQFRHIEDAISPE